MSTNTPNLDLLKKDPMTDGLDTFNVQTMLNDNWDKIDATTGPASSIIKGVVKIGSGINVDGAGVISVPTLTAPVSSVNSKTGVVVLVPSDIGAATSAQGTKADSALQTSQLGAVGGVAKQDDLTTHSAGTAAETVKGHVELATPAETTTGTDNTRAVHPAGLKVELDKKITHSLATAVSDFLVSSGAGVFVKKTLAEVKTILGLGTAAYTASTAYATAAQGTLATKCPTIFSKRGYRRSSLI